MDEFETMMAMYQGCDERWKASRDRLQKAQEDHSNNGRERRALRKTVLIMAPVGHDPETLPWSSLWLYEGQWGVSPGSHIIEGAREAMQLARILGEPVEIGGVNGGSIIATGKPDDTEDEVLRRLHESGGPDFLSPADR